MYTAIYVRLAIYNVNVSYGRAMCMCSFVDINGDDLTITCEALRNRLTEIVLQVCVYIRTLHTCVYMNNM